MYVEGTSKSLQDWYCSWDPSLQESLSLNERVFTKSLHYTFCPRVSNFPVFFYIINVLVLNGQLEVA